MWFHYLTFSQTIWWMNNDQNNLNSCIKMSMFKEAVYFVTANGTVCSVQDYFDNHSNDSSSYSHVTMVTTHIVSIPLLFKECLELYQSEFLCADRPAFPCRWCSRCARCATVCLCYRRSTGVSPLCHGCCCEWFDTTWEKQIHMTPKGLELCGWQFHFM